jgi:predicted DNA binding CopG/RHH family protein
MSDDEKSEGVELRDLAESLRGTRATFTAKRPKRRGHINVRLSDDEAAALDRCAARWGLTYSELVRMWLRQDEQDAEDGSPPTREVPASAR